MTQQFYRAFEDRYRGSRELIKHRLSRYIPFLQALHAHYPDAPAIDLGCGRGEWLEVLNEHGFAARGVDLDEGMLAVARERGLMVSEEDALAALAKLQDGSVAVVSAFHLVEHIPFDSVRILTAEALRVLVPGGLMILETPNPENIVVGSSDFYTDPSHLRPIPPNLLAFVAEHAGYARHLVVRLQENPQLHDGTSVDLLSVLSGASPDYSIVAQKQADAPLFADFAPLFSAQYGIDMKSLALRYDSRAAQQHAEIHHGLAALGERISADRSATATEHQLVSHRVDVLHGAHAEVAAGLADVMARFDHLASQMQGANVDLLHRVERLEHSDLTARVELLEDSEAAARVELLNRQADEVRQAAIATRVEELERHVESARQLELDRHAAELERLRSQFQQATSNLEVRLAQAQQLADAQAQRIAGMLQSRSWRSTAPLRGLGALARQVRGTSQTKDTNQKPHLDAPRIFIVLLRRSVQAVLRRPRLKHFARTLLAYMPGVQARLRHLLFRHDTRAHDLPAAPPPEPLSMGELPPRVARIYRELKQAQLARKE